MPLSILRMRITAYLSLFTSLSTLICCALPSLLVALGLGAVVAGAVSNVPALVWLSERKLWVFGIAGLMLSLGGIVQWYAKNLPCPIDANEAKACESARRISKVIYGASVMLYLVGAGVAFLPELLSS